MKYLQRKTKHFLAACTGGFLSVRTARPGWHLTQDGGKGRAECPSSSQSFEAIKYFGFASVKEGCVTGIHLCPEVGAWAVCLHSSSSDALSKHGSPSLGYDCNIMLELTSLISKDIHMQISLLCQSCTWPIMSDFIDTWLTSIHLTLEWMSAETTCSFSQSVRVKPNRLRLWDMFVYSCHTCHMLTLTWQPVRKGINTV